MTDTLLLAVCRFTLYLPNIKLKEMIKYLPKISFVVTDVLNMSTVLSLSYKYTLLILLYFQADKQTFKSSEVVIKPMWDNVKIHEEIGLPMHMAWNKGQSSATVDALITEAQPFNRA